MKSPFGGPDHHAFLLLGRSLEESQEVRRYFALDEDVIIERFSGAELGIEVVKELRRRYLARPPFKPTLILIDLADQMSQEAASVLLKLLEEPPKNLNFLLQAKTDQVLPTIQSRCLVKRLALKSDGAWGGGLSLKKMLSMSRLDRLLMAEKTSKAEARDLSKNWLKELEEDLRLSPDQVRLNLLSKVRRLNGLADLNLNERFFVFTLFRSFEGGEGG